MDRQRSIPNELADGTPFPRQVRVGMAPERRYATWTDHRPEPREVAIEAGERPAA